jgi:hypothetical protein
MLLGLVFCALGARGMLGAMLIGCHGHVNGNFIFIVNYYVYRKIISFTLGVIEEIIKVANYHNLHLHSKSSS